MNKDDYSVISNLHSIHPKCPIPKFDVQNNKYKNMLDTAMKVQQDMGLTYALSRKELEKEEKILHDISLDVGRYMSGLLIEKKILAKLVDFVQFELHDRKVGKDEWTKSILQKADQFSKDCMENKLGGIMEEDKIVKKRKRGRPRGKRKKKKVVEEEDPPMIEDYTVHYPTDVKVDPTWRSGRLRKKAPKSYAEPQDE